VWQNQEGEEERQPELKFNSLPASIEGELATELASKNKFGAFNK
jgi:hypothetical protein